jgi:hypothetical protein
MKQSQYDRIERLLTRKRGATAMDIAMAAGTVCPHKRLSELKARGWTIRREQVQGRNFGRYYGTAPA